MLGDKRRDVHFSETGTSTEQDFKGSVTAAMDRARVTYSVTLRMSDRLQQQYA